MPLSVVAMPVNGTVRLAIDCWRLKCITGAAYEVAHLVADKSPRKRAFAFQNKKSSM
jgi:hypothetical protein